MTEAEIEVDSATNQEMPRMDGHLQKLGRSKGRFCPTGFRGRLVAFWISSLQNGETINKFILI